MEPIINSNPVTPQDTVNFGQLVTDLKAWLETGKNLLETFKNSPVCPAWLKPILSTIETYITILETVLGMIGG